MKVNQLPQFSKELCSYNTTPNYTSTFLESSYNCSEYIDNSQYNLTHQLPSQNQNGYISTDVNVNGVSIDNNRLYSSQQAGYLNSGFNSNCNNPEFENNLYAYRNQQEVGQENIERISAYGNASVYACPNTGFNLKYTQDSNYRGISRIEDYVTAKKYIEATAFHNLNSKKMSGGPSHSHNRQAPSSNTAWNHLQVPNYYPRQLQHAHMSNEHPVIHQPAWHTPTEPIKSTTHSHIYNLEQAIPERNYTRHTPGVDLTLQRNGSQNGELPMTPISLSVRDTNKINSLPASALQAIELTKIPSLKAGSLVVKPVTALCKLPNSNSISPAPSPSVIEKLDSPKNFKRLPKSMDSVIERLNPASESKSIETSVIISEKNAGTSSPIPYEKTAPIKIEPVDKPIQSSVIVQLSSTTTIHDESSNSSSILNVPTPTHTMDEDVVSSFSNEDSTDSNKSRRKRKPFKTMRLSKDADIPTEENYIENSIKMNNSSKQSLESNILLEQPRSESAPPGDVTSARLRGRRKTSSESETIANIAAMVQQTTTCKPLNIESITELKDSKPVSVSVIKSKDGLDVLSNKVIPLVKVVTPAQKKLTETKTFVEVENRLEEMFAGISDDAIKPLEEQNISQHFKISKSLECDDNSLRLEEHNVTNNLMQDNVTSTSNDLTSHISQKRPKKKISKLRYSTESLSEESSPKRRKGSKKSKSSEESSEKANIKKSKSKVHLFAKNDICKDVNAYDSGSNTSSIKSRGPFVHIRGPRESPLVVHIVNTPVNEDDIEKKSTKSKKYHDDSEYRHKVRSQGLHSSTLSIKYDAQTRDTTWVCVFCKLGPHATDLHSKGVSSGDLFGPYLITCNSPEYVRRLDDPYDKQFRSKKVAGAVIDTFNNKISIKRSKRKHSDSADSQSSFEQNEGDVYLGMTETEDKVYEVWAHENCIVWSPGVYLAGPKIIGLEEAVWSSCNVVCKKCHLKGANLCCVRRGCLNIMHYGCAMTSDWNLEIQNFKVLCSVHKS